MADVRSAASASAITRSSTDSNSRQPSDRSNSDAHIETVSLVDAERARAFEHARQKFAVYGREHAHVNHLASARRSQTTTATKLSPVRIRSSSTAAGTAAHASATALKNTLLLQENGELALHIDSLNYHLDGVLTHCSSTDEQHSSSQLLSRTQLLTAAQNVVALARLLALEPVQLVLKLGATGQRLCVRLRSVLSLLRQSSSLAAAPVDCEPPVTTAVQQCDGEWNALRLAVAVLAFVLTQSPDPDELFPHDVLNAIVAAMEPHGTALPKASSESEGSTLKPASPVSSIAPAPPTAAATTSRALDGRLQLRKACLKRKTSSSSSSSRDRSSSTSSVEELLIEDDEAKTSSPSRPLGARTSAELVTQQIAVLLSSFDAFSIDKRNAEPITTTDVLVLVLHSLLQLERPGAERHDHTRRYHSNQRDVATATFANVLARKRQLAENHGLSVLVHALSRQFTRLKSASTVPTTRPPQDQASVLWRLQAILSVLDQASFLAVPVQQYLASKPALVEVLLNCVDHLSAACWQPRLVSTGRASPSPRQLVADVLLVALRVLINLTHHNDAAARAMQTYGGTRVLFRAFCKVWGIAETTSGAAVSATVITDAQDETEPRAESSGASVRALEDKALFDAQLMCLSALTNCIEFSDPNRLALATLELAHDDLVGLNDVVTTRPCELLAHYFVRKVQSYVQLIGLSESQETDKVAAIDTPSSSASAHWVPEDVVLGGCASLLLGCLMKDSLENARAVLTVLPDHSPRLLLRALSAFVALHSQIGALTPEVGDSVLQVEQTLRSLLSERESDSLSIRLVSQSIEGASGVKENAACAGNVDVLTSQDGTCVSGDVQMASQSAQLPPPAPTLFKRWKNVCSTVDSDTDSGDGDAPTGTATLANKPTEPSSKTTRSPLKRPPSTTTRSPGAKSPNKRVRTSSPAPRSPALNKTRKTGNVTNRSATPTRSPAASSPFTTSSAKRSRRGNTGDSPLPPTSSAQSRSKRAQELVSELTQKLWSVSGDDRNDEGQQQSSSTVASAMTPRADWGQSFGARAFDDDERMDELDFSRDYEPRRSSATTASPKTASPGICVRSRDASPGTPSMRRRRQIVGRLHAQKSPSRVPLAAALAAIDGHAASQVPLRGSLEYASRPLTTPVRTQSPSNENALKRKHKTSAVRALSATVHSAVTLVSTTTDRTSVISSSSSTAVFDFDA